MGTVQDVQENGFGNGMTNEDVLSKQELVRKELRAARVKAHRVRVVTKRVMKDLFGVENLWLTPAQQQRMYAWWVWSERHQVSIRYIIKVVVGWARKKTAKRKKPQQFGMRLLALTGKSAENILLSQMLEDFPNGEHRDEWRWEKRERLIGLDLPRGKVRPLLNPFSLDRILYNYGKGIDQRAKKLDRAVSSQKRTRRKWRTSPW